MLDIQTQLLEAKDTYLGPIDYEKDPEIESAWTHESDFLRLMELKPACPLSPFNVKKQYTSIEKEMDEHETLFYFTIRLRTDDRLIGKALVEHVDWPNRLGVTRIGIGAEADRHKGYGSQALSLLLRLAFNEMNLHRLTAFVPEYSPIALEFFKKFGFVDEVRRRKAIQRDGQFWDIHMMGLLETDWRAKNKKESS